MSKKLFSIAVFAAILSACHHQAAVKTEDILVTDMDTTVRPNDDFFHYANGGWIKRNPIPNDETHWGIGNMVMSNGS